MSSRFGTFERLIRFEDNAGIIRYGNLPRDMDALSVLGQQVEVLDGDFAPGFESTGNVAVVTQLLCPVPSINMVLCIGVNYRHHVREAKLTVPSNPVVFSKPPDALAGPLAAISIHPEVQAKLDYEGELVVVIGKQAKNVPVDQALDYVLGYTCGNDLSARDYQTPFEVSGMQYGYAKSFDGFAPVGPCIVSTTLITDPQSLDFVTRVNGEVRQETSTSDMIWNVKQVIHHLTRGTTLRPGTCIMMGTPGGVGLFMKPPQFLKHGDLVEVDFPQIGKIKNRIAFE